MALNTAHANGGVLIHAGECILLFCDNVQMEFAGQDGQEFKGEKKGRLYLTTHRMIFNTKKQDDPMKSFSFPFVTLKDVELEQPIFGANYIGSVIKAEPQGNDITLPQNTLSSLIPLNWYHTNIPNYRSLKGLNVNK